MSGILWVLLLWTAAAISWWMIAILLVATAKASQPPSPQLDPRRISVFKPLAREPSDRELLSLSACIETFVADLDDNSELLIGCHEIDKARVQPFVEGMRERHPRAEIKLVSHADPNGCAHPKVAWNRILARFATGELWLWSDSDIVAPSGTIQSLRSDFARSYDGERPGMVTSPYVIRGGTGAAEMLDALFVNVEFFPGAVLLGRTNGIRFGFGAGMLFEAENFRRVVDWDFLGSCLAEDFHLGRLLGPVRLGSMRLTTVPASNTWGGALLHYLRWQKTIRWVQPHSFAAQVGVMPAVGWLIWLSLDPAQPAAWAGLAAVLAADIAGASIIFKLVGCPINPRRFCTIPLWTILRAATWASCWFPWPIVWRGRHWWSPHQLTPGDARAERQPILE